MSAWDAVGKLFVELQGRIYRLEEHKNRQLDENRKLSARVDELHGIIKSFIKLQKQGNPILEDFLDEKFSGLY